MRPTTSVLAKILSTVQTVVDVQPIGGGCINHAWQVTVEGGKPLMVKSNQPEAIDNFRAEIQGLAALAEATREVSEIHVPTPLGAAVVEDHAWLVMPWVEPRPESDVSAERFGRGLAKLHQYTLGSRIGWDRDNYLGATLQRNNIVPGNTHQNTWGSGVNESSRPMETQTTWGEFFRVRRLQPQLRLAMERQQADSRLTDQCEQIIDRIDEILGGRADETSLLHGDLWRGNYFTSQMEGQAEGVTLIDPAAYYGCREAEFGMLKLFGACPPAFYSAYQEQFPLNDGWQQRVSVYVLYHLLNHLNLFGRGYLEQCHHVADQILRPYS